MEDKIEDTLYIFSDGNCKNNGKPNARAAYSIYFANQKYHYLNKTEIIKDASNNKAELSGILEIFKIINEQNLSMPIIIISDSMYSINCVTSKWSDNWIKNNWKNSKKQDVKNKDLIQRILLYKNLSENKYIKFQFIKAHQIEPKPNTIEHFCWYGNNYVDSEINKLLVKNN